MVRQAIFEKKDHIIVQLDVNEQLKNKDQRTQEHQYSNTKSIIIISWIDKIYKK